MPKRKPKLVQPDLEEGQRPLQKTVHSSEEFFAWCGRQDAGELDILQITRLDGYGQGLYRLQLRWRDNVTATAPERAMPQAEPQSAPPGAVTVIATEQGKWEW